MDPQKFDSSTFQGDQIHFDTKQTGIIIYFISNLFMLYIDPYDIRPTSLFLGLCPSNDSLFESQLVMKFLAILSLVSYKIINPIKSVSVYVCVWQGSRWGQEEKKNGTEYNK